MRVSLETSSFLSLNPSPDQMLTSLYSKLRFGLNTKPNAPNSGQSGLGQARAGQVLVHLPYHTLALLASLIEGQMTKITSPRVRVRVYVL